jgi:phage pi2 protein 07
MKSESIFMNKENILRYPRLDTVLMVEGFIKKYDGEFRKRKLWESLPKKMMYQTFCVIIDYLLYSRKISIDAEGKLGWIYYPEIAKRYSERADLGRRK